MTPFPESEDMTIKRLYVALKRGDMQLLQMGAHKLHEKFHTGYQFELIDELKEILARTNNLIDIPNDIRELLTGTIENIIRNSSEENKQEQSAFHFNPPPERKTFNLGKENEPLIKRVEIIKEENSNTENKEVLLAEEKKEEPVLENIKQEEIEPKIEEKIEEKEEEISHIEEKIEPNYANTEEKPIAPEEKQEEEKPNIYNIDNAAPVFLENKSDLKNVAVFYDDKAPYIDFEKNEMYREILHSISIGENKDPMSILSEIKNLVDVPTDEVFEIVKMLNTIKGDVYFTTTSKSENIIKAFIENYVSFEIPLVTKQQFAGKTTLLIPLFGLSNIFSCPKCHEKEFFGGFHNKVLTLQCKKCAHPAYPEIYESYGLETNSPVYNWIFAMKQMANADTWILINPPIETNKALIIEFLKQSFEICKPKKVYIYSKETSKREFYKQIYSEINQNCIIKSDYTTSDSLCEDFINNEMASVKVN